MKGLSCENRKRSIEVVFEGQLMSMKIPPVKEMGRGSRGHERSFLWE